jgi:hypothetical protein
MSSEGDRVTVTVTDGVGVTVLMSVDTPATGLCTDGIYFGIRAAGANVDR